MNVSDFYYSRLLATARERKNIKNIKTIDHDLVVVEMKDGSTQQIPWCELLHVQEEAVTSSK